MPTSTVTTKGQVTIPKAIRERLGIREGDRLVFIIDESGGLIVRVDRADGLEAVQGVLSHLAKERPVSVEQMRSAVRRRARARAAAGRDD